MRKHRRRKHGQLAAQAVSALICFLALMAFTGLCTGRDLLYLVAFLSLLACLFALLVFLVRLLLRMRKRNVYLRSSLYEIDRMSGEEFEQLLAAHFSSQGYQVRLTKKSGDFGVDLLCRRDGRLIGVQAKRYKASVGVAAIQQVIGGMQYYGCDCAMVVTNSYFTAPAQELAKKSGVILWDREDLRKHFRVPDKRKIT